MAMELKNWLKQKIQKVTMIDEIGVSKITYGFI